MSYKHKIYITIVLICTAFLGCSKMEDPIAEYVKNGEIIYSTRLDSLKAFPGNNRIKFTWLLPANHSATKAIIYWDAKQKSKELPLVKTPDNNYEYTLDNMEEASYLFSIYTFDKDGNLSIKNEISTVAYGERYRSGLLNRVYIKIGKVVTSPGNVTPITNGLLINWANAEALQHSVEVEYTNTTGVKATVTSLAESKETKINDINFTQPIRYRTVFRPVKSIDTFKSDWTGNIDISKL